MSLALDHLAVVASDLTQGCEYVKDCLGIDVPFGGEHTHMGTHNCLAKLRRDEFLEVIAINPKADKPPHPRWFNLDHHGNRAPYLAHWVARADDIVTTTTRINAPVGHARECVRGKLTWQLTVPDDGSFAFDGAFPSIIQWPNRPYPGEAMHDVGCSLLSLEITHPEYIELQSELHTHLTDKRIKVVSGPAVKLVASLDTPSGVRILE